MPLVLQEMMGLAYFMLDQSRKDAEYCMENAFSTYVVIINLPSLLYSIVIFGCAPEICSIRFSLERFSRKGYFICLSQNCVK